MVEREKFGYETAELGHLDAQTSSIPRVAIVQNRIYSIVNGVMFYEI